MKTDYIQERHGLSKHPLMIVRNSIKQRCFNPKEPGFELYGKRGITLCEEWRVSFISFYNWCLANGWKKGLHIDRIDNDKGYCPENCRISTPKENAHNRRSNVIITYNGETHCTAEWSRKTGIDAQKILHRFKKGYDLNMVFSTSRICKEDKIRENDRKFAGKRGKAKMSPEKAMSIKSFLTDCELTTLEVADLFQVSYQTIRNIKNGSCWANLK